MRFGSKAWAVVVAAGLAGCGAEATAPGGTSAPEQTIRGSLSGATSVAAINEAGARVDGTLTGDRFEIALPAGHVWKLAVRTGVDGRVVYPRGGAFDGGLRIRAGVAAFDLGTLRPVTLQQGLGSDDAAPEGTGGAGGEQEQELEDGHDSCHDGLDAATGAACIDDDDGEECEGEDDDAELTCDDDCAAGEAYEPENVPPTSFGDCTEDEGSDDDGADDAGDDHGGDHGGSGGGSDDAP